MVSGGYSQVDLVDVVNVSIHRERVNALARARRKKMKKEDPGGYKQMLAKQRERQERYRAKEDVDPVVREQRKHARRRAEVKLAGKKIRELVKTEPEAAWRMAHKLLRRVLDEYSARRV